jgi:hypothetical protein
LINELSAMSFQQSEGQRCSIRIFSQGVIWCFVANKDG